MSHVGSFSSFLSPLWGEFWLVKSWRGACVAPLVPQCHSIRVFKAFYVSHVYFLARIQSEKDGPLREQGGKQISLGFFGPFPSAFSFWWKWSTGKRDPFQFGKVRKGEKIPHGLKNYQWHKTMKWWRGVAQMCPWTVLCLGATTPPLQRETGQQRMSGTLSTCVTWTTVTYRMTAANSDT